MRLLLLLLACAVSASGATYYIDFATGSDANNGTAKGTPWKHRPGMTGRTGSYSHSAGDIFIYKGGVTWDSTCWPMVYPAGGTAGNVDTDTTDHTWFTGGIFSQPVFDGGGAYTTGGMVQAVARQYFLINDITVINMGVSGGLDPTGSKGFAFVFDSCQHFTVQNLVTAHEGEVLIYVNESSGSSGTYIDINILNNDVSHASALMWMTTAGTNYRLDQVNIKNNHLHDGSSQVCHDIHGDGLAHFFSSPNHSISQTLTNLDISGNKVDGNWTRVDASTAGMSAFIFNEMFVSGKIYNNSFTVTPLVAGQIPVWLEVGAEQGMTVAYYNNTIDSSAISSSGIGIFVDVVGTGATAIVKNNLIAKTQYGVDFQTVTGTVVCDGNVFSSTSANLVYNGSFQSYATWQASGRDVNGRLGTVPTFVNAPSDLHLALGSVGIGSALDLTGSIPAIDQTGAIRIVPWDAGALASSIAPTTSNLSNTAKARLGPRQH